MTRLIKRTAFMLIFFSMAPVSASTLIDSFNDIADQTAVADGANTVQTDSAIGGWRTTEIEKNGPLGATAVVIASLGVYSHSADALTSATSKITWDSNGAGLGGINLLALDTPTFAGSNCFECFLLQIVSIDQGNVDLTIGLSDSDNNTSEYTAVGATATTFEVAFSNFDSVNLSSIEEISLTIDGSIASDLVLDFKGYTGTEVPLPAAGWLFISGLIGFLGLRKKK